MSIFKADGRNHRGRTLEYWHWSQLSWREPGRLDLHCGWCLPLLGGASCTGCPSRDGSGSYWQTPSCWYTALVLRQRPLQNLACPAIQDSMLPWRLSGRNLRVLTPWTFLATAMYALLNRTLTNAHERTVLLHNGRSCNACTIKRIITLLCIPKQSTWQNGVVP